jgi:RNA polymerase sigma factor (TIGR02999 family)
MSDATDLLKALQQGETRASAQLLPLVYDELRRLARKRLAQEKPGQTLDATGLVHEAYLRLVGQDVDKPWDGRGHFFAAAAEAMRRILVESARHKGRHKHGGGLIKNDFDEEKLVSPQQADELLALDAALDALDKVDRTAAELVKLRYFAGFSLPEAADLLGMSPRSADRLWAYARAWLRTELTDA